MAGFLFTLVTGSIKLAAMFYDLNQTSVVVTIRKNRFSCLLAQPGDSVFFAYKKDIT